MLAIAVVLVFPLLAVLADNIFKIFAEVTPFVFTWAGPSRDPLYFFPSRLFQVQAPFYLVMILSLLLMLSPLLSFLTCCWTHQDELDEQLGRTCLGSNFVLPFFRWFGFTCP